MKDRRVESLYQYLDEAALYLEKHWDCTYLEGVAEAGENLFRQEVCQPLEPEQQKWLLNQVEKLSEQAFDKEEVRKAFQLAVLKGMKGAVQPHHSMTPDAVCLFLSYLVNKGLQQRKEPASLLDLAAGSGNLVHALLNNAIQPLAARGFEVDETLVKLAYVSANLQENALDLFHQDSIEPLAFPQVDLVVTDLPVGFYPKDDVAKSYHLQAEEGHSFLHHLMIEQAIQQTKDGGFLYFVVPNFLFESEQADRLHTYIKQQANILGLLQLPKSMFQSETFGRSIFMLQKKGEGVHQPQQALLAELPSFSNKQALADMIEQINKWYKEQLGMA